MLRAEAYVTRDHANWAIAQDAFAYFAFPAYLALSYFALYQASRDLSRVVASHALSVMSIIRRAKSGAYACCALTRG